MKRPADACPGTFVVTTPSDPAPSGTAHSCFLTPYISQKELRALSELRGQTVRSQVPGLCQGWPHPCCWSFFWFPPGASPLLPWRWWLSLCCGWARQGSLVPAGEARILPVLWVLEKCTWVFSFDFSFTIHMVYSYQAVPCGVEQIWGPRSQHFSILLKVRVANA